MTEINQIVVHCSDSPLGRGDDAETIHRWHRERGWSGIGYHYVITEDGTVQNGRPEYWSGAHVRNHNRGSIGVCLIGDETFTDEQFDALYELLVELCARHEKAAVWGHRDLDPGRNCPGFSVADFLEQRALDNERG